MKNKILAGALLISISIYATAIHAQITSLDQGSILNRPFLMQGIIPITPQLQLKLIHPNYGNNNNEFFSNDVSMSSGAYMLTGSYPVGERGPSRSICLTISSSRPVRLIFSVRQEVMRSV